MYALIVETEGTLPDFAGGIPGEIGDDRAAEDAEDIQSDAGPGERETHEGIQEEEQRHEGCDTKNAVAPFLHYRHDISPGPNNRTRPRPSRGALRIFNRLPDRW